MLCPRCHAAMYVEILSAGSVSAMAPLWMWACILCGARTDYLILKNRQYSDSLHLLTTSRSTSLHHVTALIL
jgi:hypothetical protein